MAPIAAPAAIPAHNRQRNAGLGNHADYDGCNTQNGTLGEIQTAHGHDKEYAGCRNHGDIHLGKYQRKVIHHPEIRQGIEQ